MKTTTAQPPGSPTVVADDPELLKGIAAGNLASLAQIYDRYHRDVRRLLTRLEGSSAHVDDLLQATFLTLPRAAASYDGRASCRPWLFGIAVRIASRHRRSLHRLRRTLRAFVDSEPPTSPIDPEMELSRQEDFARFRRAFEKLSSKKRAAFVLIELEELSAEDAAVILRIPPATVRTRLFRAKQALRAALGKERHP